MRASPKRAPELSPRAPCNVLLTHTCVRRIDCENPMTWGRSRLSAGYHISLSLSPSYLWGYPRGGTTIVLVLCVLGSSERTQTELQIRELGHTGGDTGRWTDNEYPAQPHFQPEFEPTRWTRHGFCWTPSTIPSHPGPLSTQSSMSSLAGKPPDVWAHRKRYIATVVS